MKNLCCSGEEIQKFPFVVFDLFFLATGQRPNSNRKDGNYEIRYISKNFSGTVKKNTKTAEDHQY